MNLEILNLQVLCCQKWPLKAMFRFDLEKRTRDEQRKRRFTVWLYGGTTERNRRKGPPGTDGRVWCGDDFLTVNGLGYPAYCLATSASWGEQQIS